MTETQTAEPLRFRVRDHLQVHREILTERMQGGRKVRDSRVQSYGIAFGLMDIELPPDEVAKYGHALEPTDDRSRAALEALHFKAPVREPEVLRDHAMIAAAVVATIKVLVEAGALKLPSQSRSAG